MKRFKYKVINNFGEFFVGTKEFESKDLAYEYLVKKGFKVIYLKDTLNIDLSNIFSQDIGGIPLKEKLMLMKELYIMLSAGISIIQSLDILINQVQKKSLQNKLKNIYKNVESGVSLSESFAREKGILNDVQINLLSAGEKSGNLVSVIESIMLDMEKSAKLRSKLKGALIYPIIILIVLIVVIVLMVTIMIPQMKDLYKSFGQNELPFTTQFLINLSEIFANPIFLLVLIILLVSSLFFLYFFYKTPYGRRFLDKLKFKIPIFGKLFAKIELTRFCNTFSMLLSSGVPIVSSLEITIKSVNNVLLSDLLESAKNDILKGGSISLSITRNDKFNLFPKILNQIIFVGEQSGKLDKVLKDMSIYYQEEVDQLSSNLTKLMEPLIMLVVGFMVMFLALAVYTPTLQLIQNIA